MRCAGGVLLAACALASGDVAGRVSAQAPVEAREVRQLVTFRFLPGQTRAALELCPPTARRLASCIAGCRT
ncbi:MAG: hypothetical protein KA371_05670 [Acidobacteria bacterium]|nr:hypothetical protein [Acidobacteriota bacterium]